MSDVRLVARAPQQRPKRLLVLPQAEVQRTSPVLIRIAACDRTDGPCVEWPFTRNAKGYGVGPHLTSEPSRLVTRQTWTLANGPVQPGMVVCHRCDNPSCYRLAHLFLGTVGDNARDMVEKGRRAVTANERSGCARLTDEEITELRAGRAAGATTVALAERFGVGTGHVSRVCRGLRRPVIDASVLPVVPERRCKYGHEYTPENTYLRPDGGGRMCRACIHRRAATRAVKGSA